MSTDGEDYRLSSAQFEELQAYYDALSMEERQRRWRDFLQFVLELDEDSFTLASLDARTEAELQAAGIDLDGEFPALRARVNELHAQGATLLRVVEP